MTYYQCECGFQFQSNPHNVCPVCDSTNDCHSIAYGGPGHIFYLINYCDEPKSKKEKEMFDHLYKEKIRKARSTLKESRIES